MTVCQIGDGLALIGFFAWIYVSSSESLFHEAYYKAMLKDREYYRQHPGCSLAEAHRHRDRVNRFFQR